MQPTVHHSEMNEWLAAYDGPLFDSCVTDPPYHLSSIVKRFGKEGSAECKDGATGAYARSAKGFMGKAWDGGDVAFRPETWRAVFDKLKPGAHLVAFAATRGGHRMACAIEDAGFEIRDCLGWTFATGFPKSHNISKTLADSLPLDAQCACAHDCQQITPNSQSDYQSGYGSDGAQLPCGPTFCLSDPPSQGDALTHSPSPLHAGGQVEATSHNRSNSSFPHSNVDLPDLSLRQSLNSQSPGNELSDKPESMSSGQSKAEHKTHTRKSCTPHSDDDSVSLPLDDPNYCDANIPRCNCCGKFRIPEGLGTALKPAWEIIYLARKPLSEKNIAANVLAHGTGALNIDGCRVETAEATARPNGLTGLGQSSGWNKHNNREGIGGGHNLGRWPANFALSYPADEYALRSDATTDQRRALFGWLHANA